MKKMVLASLLAASAIYAAPAAAVVSVDGTVKANKVDYITFSHAGGALSIFTEGRFFEEPSYLPLLDPMVRLFANNGSPIGGLTGAFLGVADDTIGTYPRLDFANLASGSYILAVGAFELTMDEARTGIASTPDIFNLDYTTTFRSSTDVTIGGAVPEPATWAMMIAGFGLVGAGMRRRAPKVTVTYA
ncbi:DVUA0089 family protein [Sphingobium boeckii]|uniref:Ice-binding protein C-terminal domain-containing protein n=1 Tax=Sphingobium boeckii TaxID=1082345 RepID=A0A7W9AFC7_9SPHN|nr:DVUA0089 family protein [Sphingobium boeckii]MBB5684614.1 hypothetical protein [Sphingobium boeckii]